jgi:hypothetical protein
MDIRESTSIVTVAPDHRDRDSTTVTVADAGHSAAATGTDVVLRIE